MEAEVGMRSAEASEAERAGSSYPWSLRKETSPADTLLSVLWPPFCPLTPRSASSCCFKSRGLWFQLRPVPRLEPGG